MSHHVETVAALPDPAETLAILDRAMRAHGRRNGPRVFATDDSRAVDEGLAVLRCYVAMADRRVRQAVLDVLVSVTDVDPHD